MAQGSGWTHTAFIWPETFLDWMAYYPSLGIAYARSQRLSVEDRASLQYKIWAAFIMYVLMYMVMVIRVSFSSAISIDLMWIPIVVGYIVAVFPGMYIMHCSLNLGYGDGFTYLSEFDQWLPDEEVRDAYLDEADKCTRCIRWYEEKIQIETAEREYWREKAREWTSTVPSWAAADEMV